MIFVGTLIMLSLFSAAFGLYKRMMNAAGFRDEGED